MFRMSKKHHHHDHQPHPDQPAPAAAAQPAQAADQPADQPAQPDELALARAQAEEWKNKYLYALAEIENMRKRAQKERSELLNFAAQNVLYDILEVADNFARALEADRAQTDPKIIVDGIEMIYKQLMQTLEKHHVRPIVTTGATFNPEVHEALQHMPTADAPPDTVVAELQRGYMLRDRVLRPARVVVAAPPLPPADSSDTSCASDSPASPASPASSDSTTANA